MQPCVRFARKGELDCFLLAGRYTLLEQNGLGDLLPEAERRRFSILIGGPYNSGILATGTVPGAKYNMMRRPRRQSWSAWRVSRRSADSTGFRSPPPLFNSRLAIPGSRRSYPARLRHEKSEANAAMMRVQIPAALWEDLRRVCLLEPAAPVPEGPW